MQTYTKPIQCSLCNTHTIDPRNAQPLSDGKCCKQCDNDKVIPARFAMHQYERSIRAYVKENGRVAGRKHFEDIRNGTDNVLIHKVIDRFFSLPG
jgi:hypothetical protein